MYLISVYFDGKTNRILQKYINQIAQKTENTFMTEKRVPPHMTISSIEARNAEVLIPAFETLKGKLQSGEIQFVSVGQLFPYVMYAAPVLKAYLQKLSSQVYEAVRDIEETSISKFYKPGSWLAHVTLGKTLDKDQMKKAFEVMQENFVPFSATVAEIGLAKVNPHEDVVRFELKLEGKGEKL